MGLDEPTALMGLALDIGLSGLTLGIERVEVLFEAMLGGFPSIDGATKDFPLISCHGGSPVSWPSVPACRRTPARSTFSPWSRRPCSTGSDGSYPSIRRPPFPR